MLDVRAPLLSVKDLQAWYGESHILHGVSFDVHQGEVVTLLGRNGAGKTTTLKSVMGIVAQRAGSVTFEGRELIRCASNEIARAGIAFEHGPRNQPWMWREARLRDPDGNIIFFYHAGEARRFPPWRMKE